jgi:hypothetical protein
LKGGVGYNYTRAFIDKRTGEAEGRQRWSTYRCVLK